MLEQKTLSTIFQKTPAQWGLRGDPYLWQEMHNTLRDHRYPDTEEQLTILLEQTYQQLTDTLLTSRDPIFVERYSHGGISSGYVSPRFWAETAIPMLCARYRTSK